MRSSWGSPNKGLIDVQDGGSPGSSGLITSDTGVGVLVFLCRHPNRALCADRLASILDRDPVRVEECLVALCTRGLADMELGTRGERLYRLSSAPAVWSLVAAHLAFAA